MTTSENFQETNLSRSISSAAATRANPSAERESAAAKRTSGIFGPSLRDYWAYYDRDTHCWRTSQATLFSGLDEFSETWPDSGSMRNGRVYERLISEPLICENEFSSWLTPMERDHHAPGPQGQIQLSQQAAMWPTATWGDHASTAAANYSTESGRHSGTTLTDAIRMWPTARQEDGESCGNHPGAMDSLTGATRHWQTPNLSRQVYRLSPPAQAILDGPPSYENDQISRPHWQTPTPAGPRQGDSITDEMGQRGKFGNLLEQVSAETQGMGPRRLNPRFVEWLMGFPPTWTEL